MFWLVSALAGADDVDAAGWAAGVEGFGEEAEGTSSAIEM